MRRLLAVLLLVAGLSAGCGGSDDGPGTDAGDDQPRGLTVEEAERLAVVRFANYRRGGAPFLATVPTGDQVLALDGLVEFRDHHAIASFATDDAPPAFGVLAASFDAVGLLGTDVAVGADELAQYATAPDDAWQTHAPDTDDPLDQLFMVLLNLGFDRPENAQLLRQNGAEWLGSSSVDGVAVDLMSPTPEAERTLVYYVDADGGLHRVDITLPGSDETATIQILDGEPTVPVVKAVR